MKSNSVWPPPVAVATFKQGETVRMSFSQIIGKPVDIERGKRLVCQAIGNERKQVYPSPFDSGYGLSWRPADPATDLVSFHVEKDGVRVTDFAAPKKANGPTVKELLEQIRALTIERDSLLEMVGA